VHVIFFVLCDIRIAVPRGSFLKAYQHLTGCAVSCLHCHAVLLTFLMLWNNLCDLVYQNLPLPEPNLPESDCGSFRCTCHVTTMFTYQTPTSHALLGVQNATKISSGQRQFLALLIIKLACLWLHSSRKLFNFQLVFYNVLNPQ